MKHSCAPPFLLIGAGKRKGEDSENDIEGGGKALLKRRVDLFDEAHRRYQEARAAYENILRASSVAPMERARQIQTLRTEEMRARAAKARGEENADERLRKAQDALKVIQGGGNAAALKAEAEQRLGDAQDAVREAFRRLPLEEKQKHWQDLPLYDLYEGAEKVQLVSDIKDRHQLLCLLQTVRSGTRMVETGFLRCYNVDALTLYLATAKNNKDPLSQQPFTDDELARIEYTRQMRLNYIYETMFEDAPQFEKYYPIYMRYHGEHLKRQYEFGELSRFVDSISDEVLVMVLQNYQEAFKRENVFSLQLRPDSFWKALVQWVEGSQKEVITTTYREHVEQFRNAPVFLLTQPLQLMGTSTTEYIYITGKLTPETVGNAFKDRLRDVKEITLDGRIPFLWWKGAWFGAKLGNETFISGYAYDDFKLQIVQHFSEKFKDIEFKAGAVYHITVSLEQYDAAQFEFGPLMFGQEELIPADTDAFLHERLLFDMDTRYTETWPAVLEKIPDGHMLLIKADTGGIEVVVNTVYPAVEPIKNRIDDIMETYDILENVDFVYFTFAIIPDQNAATNHEVVYNLSLPTWEIPTEEQKERYFKHGNVEQFGLNSNMIFANVTGTVQNPGGYVTFPELSIYKRHASGILGLIDDYVDHYKENCEVDTITTITVELFYPTTTKVYFNNDTEDTPLKEITYEWFVSRFPRRGKHILVNFFADDEGIFSFKDFGPAYNTIVSSIIDSVQNNQRILRISVKYSGI